MISIRKILYPTDYSDLSRPAFDLACALTWDFDAELIICHVAPPHIIALDGGKVVTIPTGEDELMMKRLQQIKSDHPQVRLTHKLLRGDPASEIVRLAVEEKPDLIVLGTHGRSGISRLLMGSVAENVMRKAPCPVVTLKQPSPATDAGAPVSAPMNEPTACCSR